MSPYGQHGYVLQMLERDGALPANESHGSICHVSVTRQQPLLARQPLIEMTLAHALAALHISNADVVLADPAALGSHALGDSYALGYPWRFEYKNVGAMLIERTIGLASDAS